MEERESTTIKILTDSSSLLFDLIGHNRLLVVLQLNAETKVTQLDAALATQEDVGSCSEDKSTFKHNNMLSNLIFHPVYDA